MDGYAQRNETEGAVYTLNKLVHLWDIKYSMIIISRHIRDKGQKDNLSWEACQ